jgi:glutathione synthase/RimK-type ligase-like ATP-grasp enzyme
MRIALASCTTRYAGDADEVPLHQALRSKGAILEMPAWDDPTVDWSSFDACLIRTTWDYMDRREQFLDWTARVAACTQLFNPMEVVRWNTLKTYLRDIEARGAAIAPTIWLEAGARVELSDVVVDRGWERAIVKPMIGASARETMPFDADRAGLAAAQAHVDRLLPREGLMIQPFLSAVTTEGEYSVISVDGHVTHAVRKIPVAGDFRVMDKFGATDELADLPEADLQSADRVREICEGILGCDGPLLYARIDLLRDDAGQLVVNEVELVEPSLFLRRCPAAADSLAVALLTRAAR